MPRKSKTPPKMFAATVFLIGKKLPSGNIYPQELADRIILDVSTGEKRYTIEEVAPEDRIKNGIKPYESWAKRAMAVCTEAHMDGYKLVMTFQIYNNKYGEKLDLLLQNNPPGSIDFFPVGSGNVDDDGVVYDYKLFYVSLELKKGITI